MLKNVKLLHFKDIQTLFLPFIHPLQQCIAIEVEELNHSYTLHYITSASSSSSSSYISAFPAML